MNRRKILLRYAKALGKGYKRVTANVGDKVIWNSKTGPVEAEFRGQTSGMDGYEATIIVREEGSAPFQITVDADQIRTKSVKKSGDVTYKGVRIEKVDGTNVGYAPARVNTTEHTITQRRRQVTVWIIHWPEDWGGGTATADTLAAAKKRIDNY